MSRLTRGTPLLLLVAIACTGTDNTVIIDGTPTAEASTTTALTTAPSSTVAALGGVETSGFSRIPVDVALDRFSQALLDGDYEIAGDLLAHESLHFFDLVAALSELGQPDEFDRSPFIAALFAGVLRDWDGHPATGIEAFSQLGALGQIPFPPAAETLEWLEVDSGVLFGLVNDFAFITMRLEGEFWKVDLTQPLIFSETGRRETMMAQTGLSEEARASDFIFEPFGFAEPTPPLSRIGGAMGALPAPVWNEFLRAVDSEEWVEAYGLLGAVTLLEDTVGVVAMDTALQNALHADEATLAEIPFADALLALTLRATFDPGALTSLDPATVFGLAMERGVVRLTTTESDLSWRTTSGVRYVGLGTFDGAGVFRSGTEWFVDGSVVAGSTARDFPSTADIDASDPIGQLIAALNDVTGGRFDAAILEPVN